MKILGIDPGLSALGYGLIEKQGDFLSVLASGTVETSSKMDFQNRLRHLHDEVGRVIEEWKPVVVVMEKPIYCQNVKTALILGQAAGMVVLAAAQADVKYHEFTPLEVKKAITGNGRASKEQVQRMVQVLLGESALAATDHISDALACAICYAHSEKRLSWG